MISMVYTKVFQLFKGTSKGTTKTGDTCIMSVNLRGDIKGTTKKGHTWLMLVNLRECNQEGTYLVNAGGNLREY